MNNTQIEEISGVIQKKIPKTDAKGESYFILNLEEADKGIFVFP
jgi:hypothetical protein